MCAVACRTVTANNYRLTFTRGGAAETAISMLMATRRSQPLQTKHYGMPKFPRPRRRRRHGRGPLAMVYEPVRWRRSQCKDKATGRGIGASARGGG